MNEKRDLSEKSHKKSILIIVLILFLLCVLVGGAYYWRNKNIKTSTSQDPATTATYQTKTGDNWVKSSKVVFNDVTSSDTHKLDDGTYRMFFMKGGNLVYADLADGANFSEIKQTGISREANLLISNPAVLKIKDNSWIMVYEQKPLPMPGGGSEETQRNLYLATSADGKSFSKAGIAIDSSKQDNYFASVPDLVLLPDNKVRMYYVSGGQDIASAISSDGKIFTRENGYRLRNKAVDPDVLIKTENGKTKWVMYHSVLSGAGNQLYKATSTDGTLWTEGQPVLTPSDSSNMIVDPDVIQTGDGKYKMFYGEGALDGSQLNLYSADCVQEIF